MELRELANNEASAFIDRLVAAAEARANKARSEAEQQVAAMRTEVDALRTELEAEAARAASLEADLDSVIEAHRQVDSDRLEAENARAHEAAARTKIEEELRGVRELLERARAEASRVSEALEDEAAQKALLEEELEGVRLALSGLERSYNSAEQKLGTFERRLAELEEVESSLRAELAEAASRANAVEAETAAAAQVMRDRYDAEIRSARSEVASIVVERDTARGDLEMIRTEAEMLRGDLAAMRDTADAARAHAESVEAERDTLRSEAQSFKTQADELRLEADKFRMEAAAARVDGGSLQAEIETARLAADAMRADADAVRAELTLAREEANTYCVEADALRAERDTLRIEAENLKTEKEALKLETATRTNDRQQKRTHADALQAEVEFYKIEAEALRAEADALRAEEQTLRTEVEKLRANEELTLLQEMVDASREHHERQVATVKQLEARLQESEAKAHQIEFSTTAALSAAVSTIDALGGATTIGELFSTLVRQLGTEIQRIALFRVKGNHLEGDYGSGLDESVQLKKIVIPMNVDSVITRAATSAGLVRAEGEELASSRPPFGGTPVSAIALPLSFQGEVLAVLYADSDAPMTPAHATFALVAARHATVLLSRLTNELKVLKELREYAELLIQEAEQMFVADVDSGRPAHQSIRRLRDTVDCGRQLYAQRAALEGTEAAGLFDEQVSIVINARASAFAEALAAATADKNDQTRAAS